jgi:NADH-ubiquinone oxidoreductase chain 5
MEIKILKLGNWLKLHTFLAEWEFIYDSFTILMLAIVFTISLLVHLYSYEYMKMDPHLTRFIIYLSYFTFAMSILIVANNFILFFFGWECVGIFSYLLINFWFTKIQANKAALKALFLNRIGDIFIY